MGNADSSTLPKFINVPSELVAACKGGILPKEVEYKLPFPLPDTFRFQSLTFITIKKDDACYYAVIDNEFKYPKTAPYHKYLKRKIGILVISNDGKSFYKYEPGDVLETTYGKFGTRKRREDHFSRIIKFSQIAHLQVSGLTCTTIGKNSKSYLFMRVNLGLLNLVEMQNTLNNIPLNEKVNLAIKIVRAFHDQFIMNDCSHGNLKPSDIYVSSSNVSIYPPLLVDFDSEGELIANSDLNALIKIVTSLISPLLSKDQCVKIIEQLSNSQTVEDLLTRLQVLSAVLDEHKNVKDLIIAKSAASKTKKALESMFVKKGVSSMSDILADLDYFFLTMTANLEDVQYSHDVFVEYLQALDFDTLLPTLWHFVQSHPDSNKVRLIDLYVEMLNGLLEGTALHLESFCKLKFMVDGIHVLLSQVSLSKYTELKDNISKLSMSLSYQDTLNKNSRINFDEIHRLHEELIAVNNAAKAEFMGYVAQFDPTFELVYQIIHSLFEYKVDDLRSRILESMLDYLSETINDKNLLNAENAFSPRRQKDLKILLSIVNDADRSDDDLVTAIRGFLANISGGLPFFSRSKLKTNITKTLDDVSNYQIRLASSPSNMHSQPA